MPTRFISKEELARFMKCRKTFYRALVLNQFFMPAEDSKFTTMKLMKDIYLEKCYFPLDKDVKVRMCAYPPKAQQLAEITANMLDNGAYATEELEKQYKRLAKHIRLHAPDVMWGLVLLSTLNEENDLFKPTYRPPKALPVEGRVQVAMIPVVREGFFDNLDPLSGKEARSKGSISFLSKKDRVEQQIAALR